MTARKHRECMTFPNAAESMGWVDDDRFAYLGCGAHWFHPIARVMGTVDYWLVNTSIEGHSWTVLMEDAVGAFISGSEFEALPLDVGASRGS